MKFSFKTPFSKFNYFPLALIINIGLVFSVQANTILKKIEEQEHKLGARIGVSIYDLKIIGLLFIISTFIKYINNFLSRNNKIKK